MQNLANLFKIIQLTRAQTQYGYILSGIRRDQVSNLAEHHYLVTFIAWQLSINLKQAGANIDVQKVLEYCLIHDLGELMGGDVSALYGRNNPKAKRFAKAFEEENQKFLAKFFGFQKITFQKMGKEILDAKNDEGLIAKIADYIECASFKVYLNQFNKSDKDFNYDKLNKFVSKIKDKTAKKILTEFISEWLESVDKLNYMEIFGGKQQEELIYE